MISFWSKLDPKLLRHQKRPNKAVLRPYFQISFCTDFKARSNGATDLIIYIVKFGLNAQKPQIGFCCFHVCYTNKQWFKQISLDSPFNFVLTLLELIDSKVKATILMYKKLDFGISAKGFTRHFRKKNKNLPNFPHIISDVFATILAWKHAFVNDFLYIHFAIKQVQLSVGQQN